MNRVHSGNLRVFYDEHSTDLQDLQGHRARSGSASLNFSALTDHSFYKLDDTKNRESAIAGMSVTVMRKNLAEVRSLFAKQTSERPFRLDTQLSCGMQVSEFCYAVAMGVHKKRTRKAKPQLMNDA